MVDEVSLCEAVRYLSRQLGLTVEVDSRVTGSAAFDVPVSIRFENVTALEALEAVLENHRLKLVRAPGTTRAGITWR